MLLREEQETMPVLTKANAEKEQENKMLTKRSNGHMIKAYWLKGEK